MPIPTYTAVKAKGKPKDEWIISCPETEGVGNNSYTYILIKDEQEIQKTESIFNTGLEEGYRLAQRHIKEALGFHNVPVAVLD